MWTAGTSEEHASNYAMERSWPTPLAMVEQVTDNAFVPRRGSLKAGHAAHRECSTDMSTSLTPCRIQNSRWHDDH